MDVTASIRDIVRSYGGSDSMRKENFSAQKTLDYAEANTLSTATPVTVLSFPYSLNYKGDVGLFGAENYYVKVDVKLDRTVEPLLSESKWELYKLTDDDEEDSDYNSANMLRDEEEKDIEYSPVAEVESWTLESAPNYLGVVEVENNKGGNKYQNIWLDVTLYTKGKKPVEKLYVKEDDYFYVGVHARNTRRLPYDFDIDLALSIVPAAGADAQYVNKF